MLYQLSYEATHWERGQFIEFISPVRGEIIWSIYEIIHIWTAVVDESEEWSSQFIFQFKQLERRSLKKSELQRDSIPWPPRYRCDALPTKLWNHTLGARTIYWVDISREEIAEYHEMKMKNESQCCGLSVDDAQQCDCRHHRAFLVARLCSVSLVLRFLPVSPM